MHIDKMLITPEKAAKLLLQNTSNRRPRPHVVLKYAKEMTEGRWRANTGELLKFSKDGTLLDGQHRLQAVVKSGVSIWFHIAFYLEPDLYGVLDTGSSRNCTDAFHVAGIKNANMLPSMIQNYYLLKGGTGVEAQTDKKHSASKLLELYYESPELWDLVASDTATWYKSFSGVLAPSLIGGFYAALGDKCADRSLAFMSQLCTGEEVTSNAVHLLRRRLLDDKLGVAKLTQGVKVALIIKAWNQFVSKGVVKCLKFDPSREPFPVILGPKV